MAKIKKAFHGDYITAEGSRNGSSFIFFSKTEAIKEMREIARGNCLEGSSCKFRVYDDFGQTFVSSRIYNNGGKYYYRNEE